ncbi:TetR/AcrR family transcriptional regulator (plasmid) [Rahnella aceris]
MKVTKAQVQANRTHVVETASALFRERGYDGISVADLMAAAGFTSGGFYKHFSSKTALMAEASACGFAQTIASSEGADITTLIENYLSREHRDARATGCTIAALAGDAARQPEVVQAAFAQGIEDMLTVLSNVSFAPRCQGERTRNINLLTHAIGAIVMSRACPDNSTLADEILEACRKSILHPAGPT